MKQDFKSFLSKNKGCIAGIILSVVICVLLFTIGFWKTLLITVIVTAGYLIGRTCDKGNDMSDRVMRLLDKILPNSYR